MVGSMSLRLFVNHPDNYDTRAAASQPVISRAGKVLIGYGSPGLPSWRATFTHSYTRDRFTAGLTERFTGSYYRGVTEVFAADFPTNAPSRTYVDLNLTQELATTSKMQLFLNVQNLFDVEPPVQQYGAAAGLNVPTDTAVYDIVGRYFTLGVRAKF